MRSPFYILHKPIVLSLDPDTKYFPSLENTTLCIHPEWPVKVFMSSPLDTLHKPIVLSREPDAKYSPSPENITLNTPTRMSSKSYNAFSTRYPP